MLGLTKAENKALIIIIVTIMAAGIIQFIRPVQEKKFNYNYEVSDSLFQSVVSMKRINKQITTVPTVPKFININTASARELEKLPGIGKVIAQRIVDYRTTYGFFTSHNDLLKVKGLGVKKIERLKKKIVF